MMSRKLLILVLAAASLLVAVASPARAGAVTVGPNQYFVGAVNGQLDRAVVQMACFGPGRPGQFGHPLPGQTVMVRQVAGTTVGVGFTGSAARSVVAFFSPSASADPTATFTSYGVPQEIPTAVLLPCSGAGTVLFFARPGSGTARSTAVQVVFVGQF
jgi:hypothetical protein